GHYSFNGRTTGSLGEVMTERFVTPAGIGLLDVTTQNFVADLMRASGIKDIHTSGRLCDAEVEGCDKQPRFKPLKINGWFWASTLQMMPPTNVPSNQRAVSYPPIHSLLFSTMLQFSLLFSTML
ncbi:Putative LOC100748578, partial [Caligus rogercresseyi]